MPFDAKGAGGVVGKKIGPLPVWGWVVGGAAAVFLFSRMRGGGSGGAGGGGGITIPTLSPGTPSSITDSSGSTPGAFGSPGQNAIGGTDTQPGGAAPWWASPPAWWNTFTGSNASTLTGGAGAPQPGQSMPQSSASAGVAPKSNIGQTAGVLAAQNTPGYNRVSTSVVTVAQPNGATGQVNPENKLVGNAPGGIPIFR